MIILKLIAIAVIVVYVIDLSGFAETMKRMIWKLLKGNKPYTEFSLKPFDCSLCMSHHIMVIWALCTGNFNLFIWMAICIISFLTIHIRALFEMISDGLTKAENKINNIL